MNLLADTVQQAPWIQLATLMSPVLLAWIAYLTLRANQKAERVEKKLETTTNNTDKKLDIITLHVNHQTEMMLRTILEGADFRALTTKTPEDIAAASVARRNLEEHMRGQRAVDAAPKPDATSTSH